MGSSTCIISRSCTVSATICPFIRITHFTASNPSFFHTLTVCSGDLKPGNIFLVPATDPRHPDGSIDLWLCDACRARGSANPISLRVRIGDFGLVTALARDDENENPHAGSSSSGPVGTELYRPPGTAVVVNASPALDLFAAGIMTFELLLPFGTRMERHETLHKLKLGHFPGGFEERIGDERMRSCVQAMLGPEHESIEDIRQRLLDML